ITKPGEGNMNVVLRIRTNRRSLILKQSRPYVQKYEQIPAPLERIAVEHFFYKTIQNAALGAHLPKVLGYAPEHFTLFLEDLGHCEDMVFLYAKKSISEKELHPLISILKGIHDNGSVADFPDNLEMRRLNYQHIFVLPFLKDNGFNLDQVQQGLEELSRPFKNDAGLKSVVESLGKKYLSRGNTLLHGDFYPGSWIIKEEKLYIIDPEFSFVGFPEFDLGVMTGHLILATQDPGYLNKVYEQYNGPVDKALIGRVAGTEIMRRLIGLAQLPLKRSIPEKKQLLQIAHQMILK
ncbi:MAG: phosphotransferase, partial [Bacteroidota bacterium]